MVAGLAVVGVAGVAVVAGSAVAVQGHRDGGPPVLVGGVALPQPYDPVDVASAAGPDLLARFVSEIDRLADRGAQLLVLPEKSFSAPQTGSGWLTPLQEVADRRGVVIVVGAVGTGPDGLSNLAIALRPGLAPVTYAKQHLVPSYEADFSAGTSLRTVDLGTVDLGAPGVFGLQICKDLDFPELSRQYTAAGAGMVASPSWDFDDDAWWHSRIAVVRGVETGMSVVRVARNGALTVSDASGRLLVDDRTRPDLVSSVLVSVRPGTHDTIYDRWGDWFVFLCAAILVSGWGSLLRRRRRAPSSQPPGRLADRVQP